MAPLFTTAWLFDVLPRGLGLNQPTLHNSEGDEVVFHEVTFPLAPTASTEEVAHRASGLALVVGAITLWNTVYLTRALENLRRQGRAPAAELLAHVAPLGWQHINLTGDYLWSTETQTGSDGFRSLRNASAVVLATAVA